MVSMQAPHQDGPLAARQLLFVGRTTLDLLYRLDALPEEDTKIFAQHLHVAPGGPATNAAITASLLGSQVTLLSALGSSLWADAVRCKLARHQIQHCDLAAGTGFEMPIASVMVNQSSGSRTALNPPLDATLLPTIEHLQAPLPAAILTDGFHLAETLPLLRQLHQQNLPIVLDGGSWKPHTEDLAPLLDAVICGERFRIPGQEPTHEAVFAWFRQQGVPRIAITRGPQPILAWDSGRSFEIAVEPVSSADTLGAGDVLHGAFLHHYAAGCSFETALRRGSALASESCRGIGVESWHSDPGLQASDIKR